ncbi:MAG TPA: 23S rRNA (guanosine(2251)-2'-O)-methyltransferase RlmB [Actinomycetota bacterium]|nr:23S rRNA (guanosine(2251)-2'-O)-methyltransferase RlmB [Actinomycetota bacterium]
MKRRGRARPKGAVVGGRRPALEAVRSGLAVEIIVAEGNRSTPGLRELLDAADRAGTPVRRVSSERVEEMAGDVRHQGVVTRVRLASPLSEQELGARDWAADEVVVVLDGVTDPHNLGAVARTVEAAGAGAMVVRRARGGALGATAMKASAGALVHLPVAEVPNIPRALERLKQAQFWVVGLDAEGDNRVGESEPPPGRVALVAGSEGEGLSRLVRETCDELVSIPMRGRVSSLNVAVAAGIALFVYVSRTSGSRRA